MWGFGSLVLYGGLRDWQGEQPWIKTAALLMGWVFPVSMVLVVGLALGVFFGMIQVWHWFLRASGLKSVYVRLLTSGMEVVNRGEKGAQQIISRGPLDDIV